MRFGVIGLGVVGSVYCEWLLQHGEEVGQYDKNGTGSVEEVNEAEIVFVCVNTPYSEELKGFDTSYLRTALECLSGEKTVVICSTVPMGFCREMKRKYPHFTILHNPEFLRAKTAHEDFRKPLRQLIGCTDPKDYPKALAVLEALPRSTDAVLDASITEAIKLSSNFLLAVRVAAAHLVVQVAAVQGASPETLARIFGDDERIGSYGFDTNDQLGYSGRCLPKDVQGFIAECRKLHLPSLWVQIMDQRNTEILNEQGLSVDYGYPTTNKGSAIDIQNACISDASD